MSDPCADRTAVIIEDDADIRGLLEATLQQAGFAVHPAATGTDGVRLVREKQPLVTTVDISLPDIDGFEVTRRLRTFSETFIVILTARGDEIDTLMGLETGADEYLTKPFRPRELRARIEAILRRSRPTAVAPAAPSPSAAAAVETGHVLAHNGLRLDRHTRSVDLDGQPVHLTRSEFDLVAAVLGARGRVLPKAELVRELWSDTYATGAVVTESDKRTVEVHLANVRRKLRENASRPRFVETVRGVGYRRAPAG